MLPLSEAGDRFRALVREHNGGPGRAHPRVVWEAFLVFVEIPFGHGSPLAAIGADDVPVSLLRDEGRVVLSFRRNLMVPWSEDSPDDPYCVGADYLYPDVPGIEDLLIWARGGPPDPSLPLYLPGSDGPVVAPGRLREVMAHHEAFDRMLRAPAPSNGQVFVEDGGYSDWTAASSRSRSDSSL